MSDRYVLLDDQDTVVNTIEYDGVSPYAPPEGTTLEVWQPGAERGCRRVDGVWTPAPPEEEPS